MTQPRLADGSMQITRQDTVLEPIDCPAHPVVVLCRQGHGLRRHFDAIALSTLDLAAPKAQLARPAQKVAQVIGNSFKAAREPITVVQGKLFRSLSQHLARKFRPERPGFRTWRWRTGSDEIRGDGRYGKQCNRCRDS